MEIGTGLAALGFALGGKELVIKLLGPSFERAGIRLADYTEYQLSNLKKILENAINRPSLNLEQEGAVPPRILKEIIDHGSLCDDEMTAEYFGGLLASSRSGIPRDDRGMAMVTLVKSLSSYQIRAHYVIYQIFRDLFLDSDLKILVEFNPFATFIPSNVFNDAMSFEENEDYYVIVPHSLTGLVQKALIHESYHTGNKEFLLDQYKAPNVIDQNGIIVHPSPLGAELFLWANAYPNLLPNEFITASLEIPSLKDVTIPPGSKPIHPQK